MEFSRFPARVKVSDGRTLDPTAIVLAGNRVRVAERRGNEAPVVLERDDVTSTERLPDRTQLITCADGTTLRVGKGKGCSCGSPLKSWYSQALREGS